jgi:hypothetical protein
MDPRVTLLKEFYRGLPKDRAKIETEEHGFGFLERLLSGGVELEYGELTLSGLLHKYKVARIPEPRMDEFLLKHVEKAWNVCLYFDGRESDVFCFNLDNNNLTDNRAAIAEMDTAISVLRDSLRSAGCEPLILASGRGYHVWGRLERAVANERLHHFMLHYAVATAATIHGRGLNHHRVKFNFYPDPRTRNMVSIRLFGTVHAKNKVFSLVLGPGGLLDEAASWEHFADHLRTKTIAIGTFEAVYNSLPHPP